MPDDRPMPLTGDPEIPVDPALGQPLHNYPSRRLTALLRAWIPLVAVALLLNVAFWEVDGPWVGPVVMAVMGGMALATGWWVLGQWNREVILYERGFRYREGSGSVPFLYAEVVGVRVRAEKLAYLNGLVRRVRVRTTITSVGGDQFTVDSDIYRRADEMADRMTEAVNTILRPRAESQLADGARVYFGDALYMTALGFGVDGAALATHGLGADDAVLLWGAFGGMKAQNRQLVLMTHDKQPWYAVPLAEVDNLKVLIALVKARRGVGDAAPTQAASPTA